MHRKITQCKLHAGMRRSLDMIQHFNTRQEFLKELGT